MKKSMWFALVFCVAVLVGLFALATPALADTITLPNNTPGTADGSTLNRTVTVNLGDLPPGATLSNVRVTIDFDKIDAAPDGCGGPSGPDPWNEEMFFYVTSPAGTRVVLVESMGNGGGSGLGATYGTGDVYNGPYSVVFDDAAAAVAGPAPASGTFRPEQPLSGFDGESPVGVWTLTVGDDTAQDPLCFDAFALELTTPGAEADLVLDKAGPLTAVAGEPIAYTIVVTNNGPSAAPLVEVVDDLPDEVAFVDAEIVRSGSGPAGECAYATCQAADVQTGEVLTVSLVGLVDPGTPGGTVLTNQAGAFADGDPTPGDGDTATTTVQADAALQIWKSVVQDEICLGAYGVYEIVVENTGPSDAVNLVVTDALSDALVYGGGSPECTHDGSAVGGTVTCTLDALPAGASYDFLIGFTTAGDVVDGTAIDNIAGVNSATPDSEPANNTSLPATFTAVQCGSLPAAASNLAITKTVGPPVVVAGEKLTFTLTIANNGPHAAEGVIVQDLFYVPMEIVLLDVNLADWSCDGGVTCVRQNPMDAGASETITIVVRVPPSDEPAEYVNMAFVTANNPDPDTGDNWAMVPYSVTAQANLTITKSALVGELVAGGDEGPFSILVTNEGPSSAYDLRVVDLPDAGLELVALQPGPAVPMTCTLEACTIDVLPAGQTAEIYALVAAPSSTAAGTYTNTACLGDEPSLVFSPGPGTAAPPPDLGPYTMTPFPLDGRPIWNDVTDVPGPTGNLSFDRSLSHRRIGNGWASWSHGYTGDVYYTNGATTLVLTLPLDTGAFYFYVEPNPFSWINIQATAQDGTTSGPIAVDGSGGAHYFGFYALGGAPLSTISITAGSDFAVGEFGIAAGQPAAGGCATAAIPVLAQADLALVKTATPAACGGEAITYTLTAHNAGPALAENVVITDDLPAGVMLSAIVGAPGTCSGSDPVVCAVGVLTPGKSIEFSLVVTPDTDLEPGTSLENRAWVASDTPDNDLANNYDDADTSITACTDLLLRKTGPDTVVAGEFITYTLVVTNAGPSAVALLDVRDDLPDEVAFYDADVARSGQGPMGLCAYAACQVPDVQPGEVLVVTLVGLVDPAAPDFSTLVNEAMAFADSDPAPDAYDTHETLVFAQADLTIDKRALKDELCLGAYGLYEIVITNHGPSTSRGITVTDVLSDALIYGGASPECTHDGSPAGGTATCLLPGLDPGASYDLMIGYNVVPSVTSGTAIFNEANVSSATHDPGEDNWDSALFTATHCFLPEADVEVVSKTFTNPPAVPGGGSLQFDVVVGNNGPHAAEGVTLVDAFLGVEYTVDNMSLPLPAGTWHCSSGLTCVRQTPMPAGITETLTFWLNIPSDVPAGTLGNQVSAMANNPDPVPGNNSAYELVPVEPQADLSIVKSVIKDEICLGAYGFYEIVVTNDGPSDAVGVVVTDTLPAELIYGGGSPGCSAAGQLVTCGVGTLAAGATAGLLIGFDIAPDVVDGTVITNTATVTSSTPDPGQGPNTSTPATFTAVQCSLPEADLAIAKTVEPFTVAAGQEITFTVTITNNGPHAAEGVIVQDLYFWAMDVVGVYANPVDWSCDGGLTCVRQNTMDTGTADVLTFVLRVPADTESGMYENDAFVSADNPDPDTWDNSALALYDVGAMADLTITKTLLTPDVVPGATALFEIVVRNDGPSDARGVAVTDLIAGGPGAVTMLSPDAGDLFIPAGQTRDVLATVRVDDMAQPGDTITNCAYVYDLPQGPANESCAGLTVGGGADLALDKTATPVVVAGEPITYVVTVYNNGTANALNVVVTDTLPADVTLVATSGCIEDPNGVPLCSLGSLAPQASASYTIVVLSDGNLEPGTSLENVAVVGSGTYDPIPGNNRDDADTSIVGLADLSIDKDGPAATVAGTEITYTLLVENAGPSVAQSVDVVDDLPEGVTLLSAEVRRTGGGSALCGGTLCELGDVAPGETVTVTVAGLVDAGLDQGTVLTNSASVLSDTPDDDPADNSDQVTTVVGTEADLGIVKTDLGDPVQPGAGLLYEFNVTNYGPSDAVAVIVTDTLDVNVTFAGATAGCSHDGSSVGGIVTCTVGLLPASESTDYLLAVYAGAVPSGTILYNTVVVASVTYDPNPENNGDDEETTVREAQQRGADLAITKVADRLIAGNGDLITYTLTVTNGGLVVATDVEVVEMIPSGAVLVSIDVRNPDSNIEFCTPAAICYLDRVKLDTLATITTVVQVREEFAGHSLTNLAHVSGDQPDNHPDNNIASATVAITATPPADLSLLKLATPTADCGGTITYSLQVRNHGPAGASHIVVADVLPPYVTYNGVYQVLGWHGAADGCSDDGAGTIWCEAASLPVDEWVTFYFTVTVADETMPGLSLENSASVTCDASDPDMSDNADTADTSIVRRLRPFRYYLPVVYKAVQREIPGTADLVGSFSLEPNRLTFDASDPVTITVCVENQGDAPVGPFWVDFYINPNPIPTHAEILWQQTCTMEPCYGIAWLIAGLGSHQSYCMTSEPGSYFAGQTEWLGSFAPGTTDLYLYVDSWYPDDPGEGAMRESDETNNGFALHGLIVTGEVVLDTGGPAIEERPAPR